MDAHVEVEMGGKYGEGWGRRGSSVDEGWVA
jgi:hypothetical protein